ncbi:MAG TPA: hypothetical protein VH595_00825 [Verrucomicrobiae bacterium]|jgi:hypothetical protein|nr:hypothetical protein [Verrucomicrobiae bacterium]
MYRFPQAQIYRSELDFLTECALYYQNTETGGDFFGFWSRDGNPVIQYVLGPGERTTRTSTSFFQDIEYLKTSGSLLNRQYGLEHIGAWHSHHTLGLLKPSSGDVQTMRNALRSDNLTRFLISICNIESSTSVSIGSFLFTKDCPEDYVACGVSIVSGSSPIRDSLRRSPSGAPFICETNQKILLNNRFLSQESSVSFRLRDLETNDPLHRRDKPDKPHFSSASIWSRREGQQLLKRIYDKLRDAHDLAPVEIKQLSDERPAISFSYYGLSCEIVFPLDFPVSLPDVIVSSQRNQPHSTSLRPFRKQRLDDSSETIQKIINSLNLIEDGRKITLRHQ